MKLFDFLALVLYAFALSVIVFLLFQVFFPPVVVVEQPAVVSWWPWSGSYNYWPTWYGSGSYGGAMRHGGHGGHGEGGHGGHGGHGGFSSRPWGGASRMANAGAPRSAPSAPAPSK